jgi:hypothetical protein
MLGGWSRGTIALIVSPIGLLVISAMRLLVVSDYNTTTATAIASSGGYVNTLLGTVIPLVPIFLPYLALLLLLFRKIILSLLTFGAAALVSPTRLAPAASLRALKDDAHGFVTLTLHHSIEVILIACSLFVIALVTQAPTSVDPATRRQAIRTLLIARESIRDLADELGIQEKTLKGWISGPNISFSGIIVAVIATALLLPYISYVYPVPRAFTYYQALMSQPWVPAERINLGAAGSVVGYPLSIDNGWMAFLSAQSRTIEYIPADEVVGRLVCQNGLQNDSLTLSAALIPLSARTPTKVPPCLGSAASANLGSSSGLQVTKWTTRPDVTSSLAFWPIPGLSGFDICALGKLTVTLSVELTGAPAGFRVKVDGLVMQPGAVRFVPAGEHDSFSFTFVGNVDSSRNKTHYFKVQWRSPTGQAVLLERGTLVLEYQHGTNSC